MGVHNGARVAGSTANSSNRAARCAACKLLQGPARSLFVSHLACQDKPLAPLPCSHGTGAPPLPHRDLDDEIDHFHMKRDNSHDPFPASLVVMRRRTSTESGTGLSMHWRKLGFKERQPNPLPPPL